MIGKTITTVSNSKEFKTINGTNEIERYSPNYYTDNKVLNIPLPNGTPISCLISVDRTNNRYTNIDNIYMDFIGNIIIFNVYNYSSSTGTGS